MVRSTEWTAHLGMALATRPSGLVSDNRQDGSTTTPDLALTAFSAMFHKRDGLSPNSMHWASSPWLMCATESTTTQHTTETPELINATSCFFFFS